ncbi:trypsin-like peptidase domain-containing protein [Roseomonas fluvialis]|uniref:Serine protease n=1 Tax=Roseomonas fluvialis TaxID=1750527 RepID=A0ABN6P565_9PROT|nr:trypsin-like peptidase domain-containing protein [Roseomonas fluvialis]BDG73596.1 hypothetical protein Rmf_35250 [Roseomonas fluvialis]
MIRAFGSALSALLVCACAGGMPAEDPARAASAAAALHWTVETADGRLLGSATVIAAGQVVTNAHVVAAARHASMRIRSGGEIHAVRRVGIANSADIALLGIDGLTVAPPTPRRAPPDATDRVFAVGSTGDGVWSVSGEVLPAAAARPFGTDLIAARLPVARGFSGGPVVDAQGRLVGVVMAAVADNLSVARRLSATGAAGGMMPSLTLIVPVDEIERARW